MNAVKAILWALMNSINGLLYSPLSALERLSQRHCHLCLPPGPRRIPLLERLSKSST